MVSPDIEQKWLPGPNPAAKIFSLADASLRQGAGFTGHEYIQKHNGIYPFSAMLVEAETTQKRTVEEYEKTYLMIRGEGEFIINGDKHSVERLDLISLPVGTRYSYKSEGAKFFEFNTLPSNLPTTYEPRVIRHMDIRTKERTIDRLKSEGFVGHKYITDEEGHPHNAYLAYVGGRCLPRAMIGAWRNYFVIDGKGAFELNGVRYHVKQNQLVTIPPENTYVFEAQPLIPMTLFEFNTPPSTPGTYHKV